jgi:uncharacterized membrane protein YgcG
MSAHVAPASSDTRYDVRPYVREHLQRAFGWSRRVVASVLVFAWLFTWLGVYRIDLRVFTTILVVAFGTHAVLQRLFVRVRNEERFLFLDAFLKCLLVTATLWVWGGSEAGLAAIFYVIPIVYHSVTRSRRRSSSRRTSPRRSGRRSSRSSTSRSCRSGRCSGSAGRRRSPTSGWRSASSSSST